VAMAGDGVQALKQADLGIAMGSGSQASRPVARIVLLDRTFAAVPQVLAEAGTDRIAHRHGRRAGAAVRLPPHPPDLLPADPAPADP